MDDIIVQRSEGPGPGDLDGDGDLDLIVPVSGYSIVEVLMNVGYPAFALTDYRNVACLATNAAPADLDGDGDLDIAVTNSTCQTVTIMQNGQTCTDWFAASYRCTDKANCWDLLLNNQHPAAFVFEVEMLGSSTIAAAVAPSDDWTVDPGPGFPTNKITFRKSDRSALPTGLSIIEGFCLADCATDQEMKLTWRNSEGLAICSTELTLCCCSDGDDQDRETGTHARFRECLDLPRFEHGWPKLPPFEPFSDPRPIPDPPPPEFSSELSLEVDFGGSLAQSLILEFDVPRAKLGEKLNVVGETRWLSDRRLEILPGMTSISGFENDIAKRIVTIVPTWAMDSKGGLDKFRNDPSRAAPSGEEIMGAYLSMRAQGGGERFAAYRADLTFVRCIPPHPKVRKRWQ